MNQNEKIIRELLKKRGVVEEATLEEFLSDKPKLTYDPFLLLDLEAGVDLILSTIKNKGRICIYGDYDCDGITSVSLMLQILSHLTENLEYYIPSRFDEGYGLNKEAIKKIYDGGADLIVTVDCGSVSTQEVKYANQLGIDIIITDHHNLGNEKPDCLVINPKQSGCSYPFKGLAGCGVAFKLAQGIVQKSGLPKANLSEVLDLVAIGTIGDIVPLIDENRTLVKYGINKIRNTKRLGLLNLIIETGLKQQEITSENIAYLIVPHINSAGRISNPRIAIDLLILDDLEIVNEYVNKLISFNKERRKIQEEVFRESIKIIEEEHVKDDFKVVLIKEAHEGITGIVAGKIKDKYERSAIVLTKSGEYLKGTGRSISTVDIHKLLKGTEGIFEKFGGHAGACGFLMKPDMLDQLRKYLDAQIKEMYKENKNLFILEKEIDYTLSGEEINLSLISELEKIGPFGNCNEKPYFEINKVKITKFSFLGNENKHVRFTCICDDSTKLECILFGDAVKYTAFLKENNRVNIFGYPNINSWKGNLKIQFVVDKIKC